MFELNTQNLLIKGRQGDSASFTFNFSRSISDYCMHFYIKKNLNEEPIIDKVYNNLSGSSLTVSLLPSETELLNVPMGSYAIYFWGLKAHLANQFAQTIIPKDYKMPPMMYIYPKVGGECNE